MKFICDPSLGRLAKWLRVLGIDTAYDPSYKRADLVRIAKGEGRVILTRARKFLEIKNIPQVCIIEGEDIADQLKQLKGMIKVRPFTRCLRCNVLLEAVSKDSVKDSVPPHAFAMHNEFYHCPMCQRVYWAGSHVERMKMSIPSS